MNIDWVNNKTYGLINRENKLLERQLQMMRYEQRRHMN